MTDSKAGQITSLFRPPGVIPFARFVADRLQADRLVVVGADPGDESFAEPSGRVVVFSDASRLPQGWRSWDFLSPLSPLIPEADLASSVLVALDPFRRGVDGALVIRELAALARQCALTVIASPQRQAGSVDEALGAAGLEPTFTGVSATTDSFDGPRDARIWIIENPGFPLTRRDIATPDDFKVIGFVTAYNEEDIIAGTIEDLAAQGAHAYVIDNWSTDRTYEIAKSYVGKGVAGIERYPADGPPEYFDLKTLLTRIEQLTLEVDGDWFIKHDADEARRSPWPGVSLRDGLYRAQLAGYNCVDFTVLNFRPVDDSFEPGTSFVESLRHFEFGAKPGYFRQFKAWRGFGQEIDYASYGSHRINFPGLRVFPYKFLLRHYPVRSQAHGERKIFAERKGRFLPEARKRGWHTQYDAVRQGQSFLADPEEIELFDESVFMAKYLIERLSGVGVPREVPQPEKPAGSPSAPPVSKGVAATRSRSGVRRVVAKLRR